MLINGDILMFFLKYDFNWLWMAYKSFYDR